MSIDHESNKGKSERRAFIIIRNRGDGKVDHIVVDVQTGIRETLPATKAWKRYEEICGATLEAR